MAFWHNQGGSCNLQYTIENQEIPNENQWSEDKSLKHVARLRTDHCYLLQENG
jgi:hypothetical protein